MLREINDGGGRGIYDTNPRDEGTDLEHWEGRLDVNHMTMVGHSYGATLALQTLKGGPSETLPFEGAIILDPGKQSGPLNDDVRVPALVIHSNSWSKTHSVFFGRPHFEVVRELVEGIIKRGRHAWFVTSLGTSHPSVTDAPLIEPLLLSWTTGATIDVRRGVDEYVEISEDFLRFQHTGRKTGLLEVPVTHPTYDNKGTRWKSDMATMPGEYARYWQVHVAPDP